MNPSPKEIFNRAELLLGADAMERLGTVRVILFGVGGVGSWCAEGLVRSGITHLTLVDADRVAPSNINRQRMATTFTVGRPKVDVLKEMLLEINPSAEITALEARFTEATADSFALESYDYIIDAIDALKDKAALILRAAATPATFFSSMGAACKIDPTKVRVASFWEVRGCPLGAMLRKKLRKAGTLPAKDFLCVYDEELLENRGTDTALPEELKFEKKAHNGSLVTVTAHFGFTLASTPAERTVVLSGTSFRIVPRRYASGQLICDRITDSGSRLRDQRLSLDKMEIADMYAIVRETPVDERTRGALESRALLVLREGTPDEFRHLIKRYPARLSALEPFLEAHRMER